MAVTVNIFVGRNERHPYPEPQRPHGPRAHLGEEKGHVMAAFCEKLT